LAWNEDQGRRIAFHRRKKKKVEGDKQKKGGEGRDRKETRQQT